MHIKISIQKCEGDIDFSASSEINKLSAFRLIKEPLLYTGSRALSNFIIHTSKDDVTCACLGGVCMQIEPVRVKVHVTHF